MRLINVHDLGLREFHEKNVPKYIILSHRWVDGQEVTYQEWLNPSKETSQKSGFEKIVAFSKKVEIYGSIDWVWVDTCCIDKSSSAELSEAINSMYSLYQNAHACFAYLMDVEIPAEVDLSTDVLIDQAGIADSKSTRSGHPPALYTRNSRRPRSTSTALQQMRKSSWFTRGWTLQELIAPANVYFYSNNWDMIGTKRAIASYLATLTSIPIKILQGGDISSCSVAQKMSWASQRETTRTEDLAYCLMGLFGVNMPLPYGEGEKAFTRLQEAIICDSMDQSIFAWDYPPSTEDFSSCVTGILARSPRQFHWCEDVVISWSDTHDNINIGMTAFTLNNLGMSITWPMRPLAPGIFEARLACCRQQMSNHISRVFLRKVHEGLFIRTAGYFTKDEFKPRKKFESTHIVVATGGDLPTPSFSCVAKAIYAIRWEQIGFFGIKAVASLDIELGTNVQQSFDTTGLVAIGNTEFKTWLDPLACEFDPSERYLSRESLKTPYSEPYAPFTHQKVDIPLTIDTVLQRFECSSIWGGSKIVVRVGSTFMKEDASYLLWVHCATARRTRYDNGLEMDIQDMQNEVAVYNHAVIRSVSHRMLKQFGYRYEISTDDVWHGFYTKLRSLEGLPIRKPEIQVAAAPSIEKGRLILRVRMQKMDFHTFGSSLPHFDNPISHLLRQQDQNEQWRANKLTEHVIAISRPSTPESRAVSPFSSPEGPQS